MHITTIKKENIDHLSGFFIIEIDGDEIPESWKNREYNVMYYYNDKRKRIIINPTKTEEERAIENKEFNASIALFNEDLEEEDKVYFTEIVIQHQENEERFIDLQQRIKLYEEQIKEEIEKKYRLQFLFFRHGK